jgi:hypothetical protein
MLFAIEKQLAIYRQRIEELFARHPDHDLFGSLPGAGPKLAPRLLSEIGDDRQRFGAEAQALQCLGGTAPVTKRSGKGRKYWHVHQRWACDKHLRHANREQRTLCNGGTCMTKANSWRGHNTSLPPNKNQSRRRTFCVEVERKKMPDPEEDPVGSSAQKSAFKPVDSDQFQIGTLTM